MFEPNKIIDQYGDAIHKTAHTYYKPNPRFSYADLVSEAKMAAIKACSSYKENENSSFKTYLTSTMNNEVCKFVSANNYDIGVSEWKQRKEWKDNKDKSNLNKFNAVRDTEEEYSIFDIVSSGNLSPDVAMEKAEDISILHEELGNLPEREKVVLNARWLEGKTLEEIATGFNVTKQTIFVWEKRGFERLQKRMKQRLGE